MLPVRVRNHLRALPKTRRCPFACAVVSEGRYKNVSRAAKDPGERSREGHSSYPPYAVTPGQPWGLSTHAWTGGRRRRKRSVKRKRQREKDGGKDLTSRRRPPRQWKLTSHSRIYPFRQATEAWLTANRENHPTTQPQYLPYTGTTILWIRYFHVPYNRRTGSSNPGTRSTRDPGVRVDPSASVAAFRHRSAQLWVHGKA